MINQVLSLLKIRDFSILFIGQFISKMGSAINTIGLSLCVLKFDNPVLGMGTLSLLLTIPWIIFGPIAGVFADRYSKKQIIVVCDMIRGLLSIALFFTQNVVLFYLIGQLVFFPKKCVTSTCILVMPMSILFSNIPIGIF